MNRREFFRRGALTTAAAAAAVAAVPSFVPCTAHGAPGPLRANDRIRVGFIGLGGRARWIISSEGLPGAQIIAVADCNLARCHEAARVIPDGTRWQKYQNYRQMLDRERLDAVFVETTTHARVLACIHALQAGLDVYAEKPLTLTIAEGRVLVNAVRRYGKILQTGTQQRSMPNNRHASQLVREGAIGRVHTVIVCNFLPGKDWTTKPGQPTPTSLDWDQWCNQTELRPYHPDLYGHWADYWDYDGGGQSWGVTGWGAHALDQVQCALGTDSTGPVEMRLESTGPVRPVTLRYANGTLLKLEGRKRGMEDLGAIFVGDRGRIEIRRGNCLAEPRELLRGAPPPTPLGAHESLAHIENFFACMRSRRPPNADAETGHRSSTLCHLVNICRKLGRSLQWDPSAEHFVADDQANRLLSRPRRRGYELPTITW